MAKKAMGQLFDSIKTGPQGSVECLGMTFENDRARRQYFLEKLREKLQDPEFRKIEGFPTGNDEDILAMSDPPYYTACPNPFLAEFIKHYGKPYDRDVPYNRKPFAVDVSEGKTDPVYKAHSYHTKVPHLAIVPSILHYTEPGDIVLDGFCGSGMTGVASQWCGTAPESYRRELETTWGREGLGKPIWGVRRSVQCDLAPAATFIAANYNLPFNVQVFAQVGRQLLDEVEHKLGWMYETLHTNSKTKGRIEYTVWSEVFTCPNCTGDVVFLDEALDQKTQRVKDTFPCPHCQAELTKSRLERSYEIRLDPALHTTVPTPRRQPVLISYKVGNQRYEKKPDDHDLKVLKKIESLEWPAEVPTIKLPYMHMTHERARMANVGITHVHHFFLPRTIHILSAYLHKARGIEEIGIRNGLIILAQHQFVNATIMNRYRPASSFGNAPLGGVYYISSLIAEANVFLLIKGSLHRIQRMAKSGWERLATTSDHTLISTGSTTSTPFIANNTIDYIFTDPPFGENIYYADLNFLVESWYGVFTNAKLEAIVDKAKKKVLLDYQHLMQRCFEEYHRVLKPGRWMTVVFHNSRNAVWNAIQEAMLAAGFVVADVRTMDKQQGSYRQVTSALSR